MSKNLTTPHLSAGRVNIGLCMSVKKKDNWTEYDVVWVSFTLSFRPSPF